MAKAIFRELCNEMKQTLGIGEMGNYLAEVQCDKCTMVMGRRGWRYLGEYDS